MKLIYSILSFGLLIISVQSACAEPELSLKVYPAEFDVDRYLRVWGSMSWDAPDIVADLYLAVIDDSGAMGFLSDDHFDPVFYPSPFIGSVYIADGTTVTDHFFGAFPGRILDFSSVSKSYVIALALTETDTLELSCPPAFAMFQIIEVDSPQTWRDNRNNYAVFEYRSPRWYLTAISLEVEHSWTYFSMDYSYSGSGIDYFYRQGLYELDGNACGDFFWNDGYGNGYGLNVYLSVYRDYASVYCDGTDRQTRPPDGAYFESWSLSTTLRQ
ncbi:MAG: hypothetical protein JW941_12775 [Candidatus Coatesbacteria bacterium]|nr:hypothetical protein [Candidatus Coatesbacteria bacterium]